MAHHPVDSQTIPIVLLAGGDEPIPYRLTHEGFDATARTLITSPSNDFVAGTLSPHPSLAWLARPCMLCGHDAGDHTRAPWSRPRDLEACEVDGCSCRGGRVSERGSVTFATFPESPASRGQR